MSQRRRLLHLLVCLFVSAATAAAAASGLPSLPPFSFQLHSFNDLRKPRDRPSLPQRYNAPDLALTRWHQANGRSCCPKLPPLSVLTCLSKLSSCLCCRLYRVHRALTAPQVDVQWLPPSLCALQERASSHDSRGCFVLNHDTVDHNSRRTFNSTEDLNAYLPSLPLLRDATRHTYLSLCFKGCGGLQCPCGADSSRNSSSSSTDWLSLVDELLDNLNATVIEFALNARFILDGAGNPSATHSSCLSQRWRPLPSLFTAGDGNAIVSNSPTKLI
jgi:hypothetical protein